MKDKGEFKKELKVLEYLASFLTLLGVALISLKKPVLGQLITASGNYLFAYYGFKTKQKALGVSALILGIIESYGVWNWLQR